MKFAGSRATIPIIMISDIPLPIPLSVILSPSHITNIVPAVRVITDVIWKVGDEQWAPVTSSDNVVVNASVFDPDSIGGVNSLFAYIGEGIEGSYTKLQMFDDGNHQDGSAGDGVFGIILDEQASGTRIRFYIEAVANDTAGTRTFYPARAAHDVFTFAVD